MTDSHRYNGSSFLILHEGAQLICPTLSLRYLIPDAGEHSSKAPGSGDFDLILHGGI